MISSLISRPATECRYDVVTLGEVMLRLDPGNGRVRNARSFSVTEDGGEYNVGRALRRCFDQRVAHVGAIGDNEVGRLLEDLMLQGGVGLDYMVWKPADDVGRAGRNPLNFTERGFGVRASRGTYDRANSATSELRPEDVDWNGLFREQGARWFHTGGIFAGLSSSTFATACAAMKAARESGVVVSYDINYRPSLWAASGGTKAASRLTAELLDNVDVLFGVEADGFAATADRLGQEHPGLQLIAVPTRVVHSASSNDWGGLAWSREGGVVAGRTLENLEILDRVGGGDGFAAGLIGAALGGESIAMALELAIAHGALVMTTAGDTSAVDLDEVRRVAAGGAPTAVR